MLTEFPNGVSSFGIPLIGSAPFLSIPKTTGKYFFVDSAIGSDGNDGTDSSLPLATIARAIALATSGAGDVIIIYPGTYAENLTVSKNDITFVAAHTQGNSKRVGVAPATGIALILAQCNRFTAIGIRFVGTSAVGVKSDGEGSKFVNCDFTSDTSDGFKFLGATNTDFTGSGTLFLNCIFRECGGAGLKVYKGTGVCLGLQATNVNVWNCQFYLNTDDDVNDDAAGGTETYFDQWDISGCKFMTRAKTTYLDLNGGSGSVELLVSNCYFAVDDVGRLTATQVQLPAGGVGVALYDATGIVDAHTF